MSATLRKPLVVVEKSWKEDAPKQELTAYVAIAGSTEKKKVVNFIPIDDGSRGIEHLVGHTMKQFDRHAKEALVEKDLFQEFTKCLDGATLHMWELIVSERFQFQSDVHKNKKNFEKARKLLINEVCGRKDMRDTQIFWMNHMMKKPRTMSPRDFYFRFKEIFDTSMALGGKFQKPNEHEKKTMLFNAFPSMYKEKFQESAKTIEDSLSEDIVNYFQILHDFEERKGQLMHDTKREREDDDNRPRIFNKRQRGRDRRHNKYDNDYEESRRDRDDDKRTKWNDPCPLHPYCKYLHTRL
jgi:hypothetical protein